MWTTVCHVGLWLFYFFQKNVFFVFLFFIGCFWFTADQQFDKGKGPCWGPRSLLMTCTGALKFITFVSISTKMVDVPLEVVDIGDELTTGLLWWFILIRIQVPHLTFSPVIQHTHRALTLSQYLEPGKVCHFDRLAPSAPVFDSINMHTGSSPPSPLYQYLGYHFHRF